MRARLLYLWDLVLNSYWFTPGLMALGAILLSFVLLSVDAWFDPDSVSDIAWLLYSGGADGARGVLETIAGSMITVAGVVFSITIVALTLASSQFGPRVLSNFMRDRGNQLVLGTFIATFLYCLLVLRAIRNGGEDSSAVVPHLSISVGIVLALASLGVLIYFIHHVAISIQAPYLIARIAEELHQGIDKHFPAPGGAARTESPDSLVTLAPEAFEREAAVVAAPEDGYLEAIDLENIVRLAGERHLLVRMEYRPGHFVVRGSALARVWPAAGASSEVEDRIRSAVLVGPRRTAMQDVEFTVNQLVEVAVRALSPGINDPFTAITCIDQLGTGLCHLARRDLPPICHLDERGEVRLVMRRPLTFAGMVDACFHQIRQNAGYHAAIHIRLLETLTVVVECARRADQIEQLLRHGDLVVELATDKVEQAADRADVEERYQTLLRAAELRGSALRAAH